MARRFGIDKATARYGFKTVRVDDVPRPETITAATHQRIAMADFVIADLTDARPNCYYEVGYAQALGRPLIFLIREGQKPHFNIAAYPFIEYSSPEDLRVKLEAEILNQVLTSHARAGDDDNVEQFGRRSFVDPYIVTGHVRVDNQAGESRERAFFVDLRVRSLNRRRPLNGAVTFVLHRDWGVNRRQTLRVADGEAQLDKIHAAGAFTVGVIIPDQGVRLELDLARLPGATQEFRSW